MGLNKVVAPGMKSSNRNSGTLQTQLHAHTCARLLRHTVEQARGLLLVLAFLSVPFLFTGWALGQGFSGMVGTVTDTSGAVVPGARITVEDIQTGVTTTEVTTSTGNYTIPQLPAGLYSVTATKQKFKTMVLHHIRLDVGRTTKVNFTLQIGSVSQKVTVVSQAPLLQTEQAQISTLITNKQIVSLPLNGRNYLQLNFLVPGVTPGVSGHSNYILGTRGESASTPSVNGMDPTANSYFVDGAPTQEVQDGSPAFEPSVDAIQQFRVQTSNFSARYGGEAAGQINLITKSGTNQFHGSLYDFLRNSAMDARSYFSPTIPPLIMNQFGGTVGGPVLRNKTFFFFSYEGERLVDGATERGIVPTAAQRSGDFSSLLTQNIQLQNPLTGQPFPDNQVPVNPIITKFLNSYVPLPNASAAPINWEQNSAARIHHNQYIGRVDQVFSPRDRVFARYIFDGVDNTSAKFFPTDSYAVTGIGQNLAVGWTHTFSPRLLSTTILSYNRFSQDENNGRAGKVDVLSQLGISGFCEAPGCWGQPSFDVTGFSGFGEHGSGQVVSGPRHWVDEIFNVGETFIYETGSHTIQFGFTGNQFRDSFQEAIYPRGIYSFQGQLTNPAGTPSALTSFADFDLGYPRSILASITPFTPYWSYKEIAPWIQDNWRVTPNLTLNLGLRYDRYGRPMSRYNDFSNIDFSSNPPQLITSGEASKFGFPKTLVNSDNDNIGPRFGVAWNPMHRFVFRGGYGIYYQRDINNTATDLAINLPFITQTDYILDASAVPTFSLSDPLAGTLSKPLLVFAVDKHFRDGKIQQWNVSWQTQLSASTQATISYVGNTGDHLPRLYNINQAVTGPGSITSRLPFPTFGTINYYDSLAHTSYNSLQAEVQRRTSGGLSYLVGYTYAKCLSNSIESFSNIYDPGLQYSLCPSNMSNRFVGSYIYALPFGRGRRFGHGVNPVLERVISGWQTSGILTLTEGYPFTVAMPGDWADVGTGTTTPILTGNPNLPRGKKTLDQYFNTAAFTAPPKGQFGNAKLDSVIGPGIINLDFGLARNFHLWQEKELELRGSAFNLFNHPNFARPGATVGTPTYGKITSAGAGREIQVALKFLF